MVIKMKDEITTTPDGRTELLREALESVSFILCGHKYPKLESVPEQREALNHNAVNALVVIGAALSK